jgi:DNA-binding response OmpR family regulator
VADVSRLLLVEDDDAIAEPLVGALTREGYRVDRAANGAEALARGLEAAHDLVILDLGLPDIDGIEVCRRLRAALPALPILMLTARVEEVDAVVGLDAGADDYVSKPFRVGELLARLRALLRRTGAEDVWVGAGDVRLDAQARRAWRGSRELDLTPKEFELLALLLREAGTAVTRGKIMAEVWDTAWMGSTKTLDVHVAALRRKLADDPEPTMLKTVRGVGFRFEVD